MKRWLLVCLEGVLGDRTMLAHAFFVLLGIRVLTDGSRYLAHVRRACFTVVFPPSNCPQQLSHRV